MKTGLLDLLICPECGAPLVLEDSQLRCSQCGQVVSLTNGIPVFTPVAGEIRPSEKLARGPDTGTPWRKANWRFLEAQLAQLPAEARILDVGAGRGDFAVLLDRFQTIALDIYPYPEVDLVCDLTVCNPFRPASFEVIVLMNVLEHIYDTQALLAHLAELLKPGGRLIVAIPFLVKLHQTPVDFVRFTHYALQRFAPAHGFELEVLEGYYDPIFFLSEGTGNIKHAYLPALSRTKRMAARTLLGGIQFLVDRLETLLGPGGASPPETVRSQAPTGYHIVYKKNAS